ncbi:MAG: nucleotidyl transferase AbiEii/AbiGii toxin family protein [Candidatus Saganbacteria bacterium]|nr:nucleotidyl transferase AbiEii/AbiGii toxin family protein [Candidatus Saganbacteria bacterium]
MSNKLFWEILSPERKDIFSVLHRTLGNGYYLAGGTALALQIGHRESLDFDVFRDKEIALPLKTKIFKAFSGLTPKTLVATSDELTLMVAGNVKITVLNYYWRPLFPLVKTAGEMPLLSIKDIAATKAYALGRRGNYRDYFDLYVLVKRRFVTLKGIIASCRKKYGDIFSERMFLEQLTYCGDLEQDIKLNFLAEKYVSPARIVDFFAREIKGI